MLTTTIGVNHLRLHALSACCLCTANLTQACLSQAFIPFLAASAGALLVYPQSVSESQVGGFYYRELET